MSVLRHIPVSQLRPHPDNPRKDVGDITELAESIKQKGVLQNLTVVPDPIEADTYTIIIGHRRYAAAVLAGIEELPCTVTEMTREEQLSTMLVENMQRADLTVYEQAEGFQMMLDLGKSADEVAEMSGFSRATVYKRTKLLSLDKEKFKAASDRGATLFDFAELDKIDDKELKDHLLDTIGTNNFRNELERAKGKQKAITWYNKTLQTVRERAEGEITRLLTEGYLRTGEECKGEAADGGIYYFIYDDYISDWHNADGDTSKIKGKLWYREDFDRKMIHLYHEISEEDVKAAEERDSKAEKKERIMEQINRLKEKKEKELEELQERTFALRSSFVANCANPNNCAGEVIRFLSMYPLGDFSEPYMWVKNSDFLISAHLPVEAIEDHSIIRQAIADNPLKMGMLIAYFASDDEDNCYAGRVWESDANAYMPKHFTRPKLDYIYEFLKLMGYELSDEEVQLKDGTHPYYDRAEMERLIGEYKNA